MILPAPSLTEYAIPEGAQQSMKTATVMNMTRAERRSFFSRDLNAMHHLNSGFGQFGDLDQFGDLGQFRGF